MEVPVELYYLIGVALTIVVHWLITGSWSPRKVSDKLRMPLPPGPKGKLISGNAHQIPRDEPWKTFARWSRDEDVEFITYRIYGRRTIVLNTFEAAYDLFESRAKNYSDRPTLWMYHHLVGRALAMFSISSQHPWFPIYRRMLHSSLNPRAIKTYEPLLDIESQLLLENFKQSPQHFAKHIRRNAGAVILSLAYGWTVKSDDDYLVELMKIMFEKHAEITRPGRWLVDVFPILRFVPAWFPGAGFQRQAAIWREEFNKMESIPLEWAKKQIESGNYKESFTSQHLLPEDGHKVAAEEEEIIKYCSVALFAGGADTTVAVVTSFVLLMAMYPEAQRKAQAEIDDIVGRGVLPSSEDESRLPYVNALIKEVLRYAPAAPLGLPRRVMELDDYLNCRFPKGATVLANIWAIGRDPQLYSDPDKFKPDRFVGDEPEMDPRKFVFGFGRRICPGMNFAEKSLFLNISRILATFDILPPLGEDGQEAKIEPSWTTGVTSHPKPFECRIQLRTSQ